MEKLEPGTTMNGLCRICLCLEDENIQHLPIFKSEEPSEIALKIFQVSGVQILETENVPALICSGCHADLFFAHKLRTRCVYSDQIFRVNLPKKFFSSLKENMKNIAGYEEPDIDIPDFLYPETELKEEIQSEIEMLEQDDDDPDFTVTDQSKEKSREAKMSLKKGHKNKNKRIKEKKIFFCDRCYKSFTTHFRMQEHKRTAHTEIPDHLMFRCDLCPKKSKTKALLRNHIRTMHSSCPKRPFTCGICGKGIASRFALKVHESKHIEVDPSTLPSCPVCLKVFRDDGCVTAHRKLVHEKFFASSCPHCPHVATCMASLRKHIKSKHTKVKEFICDDCGAGFCLPSGLKAHSRTHTGEKPLACPNEDCDRRFATYKSRNNHKKICPWNVQALIM